MRWAATIANFFLPGLGYIISGHKRLLGLPFVLGMVGLTYVELSIQEPLPDLYKVMFASVFVINTAFAVDVYQALGEKKG